MRSIDAQPQKSFSAISSISLIVGIVVGIGVFRFPSLIANNSFNSADYFLFWVIGGGIALMGGFCYSELAINMPGRGGEYLFLKNSYSSLVAFLFLWSRTFLIQTGSIVVIAYIFGDYARVFYDLGDHSSTIYGALMMIILTAINITGTNYSINFQNFLTFAIISTIITMAVGALFYSNGESGVQSMTYNQLPTPVDSSVGLAMVFVLLTYGGWNEVSYLSEEIINIRKQIGKIFTYAILIITALYLALNYAYIKVLGFEGLKDSSTAGYDLAEKLFGKSGSILVAGLILISAISTANASILTGARTSYALGKDYKLFDKLGVWNKRSNSPVNALIFQLIICLTMITIGGFTGKTIATIVDFTAPVFWLFMIMITFSIYIFRHKRIHDSSIYKMPFYPIPPLLFLLACIYLLYSSAIYNGIYSLAGLFLLASGIPIWFLMKRFDLI